MHGPWAADWAVGAESSELAVLWRRCRQALAMRTSWGDSLADALLAQTSEVIDRNTIVRRDMWKADMQDRSKAARWVRHRAATDSDLQLTVDWEPSDEGSVAASLGAIKLSLEAVQEATSTEVAGLWNAGI